MTAATQKKIEEPISHLVQVHKANIPLAKGESLSQFSSRLSDAGRNALAQKLNLSLKGASSGSYTSVYLVEAFAKSAIFDVYTYKGGNEPSVYKFYAVKYDRSATGDFTFSDLTEVVRQTSYVPVSSMSIEKSDASKSEGEGESDVWKAHGWNQLFAGTV